MNAHGAIGVRLLQFACREFNLEWIWMEMLCFMYSVKRSELFKLYMH